MNEIPLLRNLSKPACKFLPGFLFALLTVCVPKLQAAITITSTLPGYYTLGNPIQGVAFQATGGISGLFTWSVSAGSLPPGITIKSNGDFSGTPSAAGTFQFTIMAVAQDPGNAQATKSFTIGIPQITNASPLPAATTGVPYSYQFQVTDGPPTGASWSLAFTGLPIGLTLDRNTGILSGTPSTRTGIIPLTVSVLYGIASATKQFSITINAATQTLQVSPAALTFAASVGNIPGAQNLTISTSAAAAIAFSVLVDDGKGGPAPAWLAVSPTAGTTPGLLRVSIVPPAQPVGVYNARIRISMTAAGASLPPVDVPVTFTVSNAPPNLTVAPSILRFRGSTATPGAGSQTFVLRNTGGGGDVPFTLSVAGKSPWISGVTASDQTIHAGTAVNVTVTVNTQGLTAGTYRDAIQVNTSLAPPFDQFQVPVSAVIVDQGAVMALSQTGARFDTIQGNQASPVQQIFVINSGSSATAVNWTAQVTQGQNLVSLQNAQGTSTPGNPTAFGIRLSNSATNSPGGTFALIQVTDPQSQGSPQFVTVLVNVAAAGTPPIPIPDPAGLLFIATTGAAAPAPQQVTVNSTSPSAVAFSISASTNTAANWLSAQTTSTTTSQATPALVSVSVAPGSLKPGVYRGTVNIAIGAIVRAVDVTLLILAPGTGGSTGAVRTIGHATSCSPATVVVAQTGLFDSFAVPAGWPATLAAQVVDDCGNSITDASVVASFSNGDPPLSLIGDGHSASYSATWQPGTPASSMTVTIDANSQKLTPAEVQIAGDVSPNARPAPSLAPAGLLNNLNPLLGAPLAPGTVTQVYGDNLADAPDQPSTVPLPNNFRNVQVLIGGLSAPIFYVSKNQLVVQLPTELSPNRTYSTLVVAGNQFTLPQDVSLVQETPGVVAFADGTLVAQRAGGALVDRDHPARPDEALTIYLVGMGATMPPVASGVPAPSDPLPQVSSDLQLTVDGQTVLPSYAGLTPGGIGLYQINFAVPDGARTGDLDVVIAQGGVKANAVKLIVAR